LDEAAVNNMLSHMLQMSASSERRIKDLSRVVYIKTHGNAFFVLSLMENLEIDGMLLFDSQSSLWSWNLPDIRDGIVVTDNVLSLLQQRMDKFAAEAREILTIAALIGFSFRADVLLSFVAQDQADDEIAAVQANVEKLLEHSIEKGIVEKGS
jgi:predicted ATPase